MFRFVFSILCYVFAFNAYCQTNIHGNYKAVTIPLDQNVPYTKTLILLHEIYNGTDLPNNFVVGSILAMRGDINAMHRLNVMQINSGSAYRSFVASLDSHDHDVTGWKLKTCFYNGKKYMALDVPYLPQQHTLGFQFVGWANSSGEELKVVTYEMNGIAQNQDKLSAVIDYVSTAVSRREIDKFFIKGNLGIGTNVLNNKLEVNGTIRAKEVKLEATNWPDYVFGNDHELMPLEEVYAFIEENAHLPGLKSAKEYEDEGVNMLEMNQKLLEKVEELTLYTISQERKLRNVEAEVELLKLLIKEKL
ncbi:hypothetical protein MM239_04855 [Belliella sp. DSM 111904]|uniref:Uncharacterized protein n=1 Tax=Belliella filtrata TaxID=2923435 RepID=A0ABS9UY91_9BACT|nr:hypothetical protein [Belliella filtrata]MCH7408713.1 hypothetical protein [Belliella filtrata]